VSSEPDVDPRGMPTGRRVANWIAKLWSPTCSSAAGRRTPVWPTGFLKRGRDANADHDHRHGVSSRSSRNGEKPSEWRVPVQAIYNDYSLPKVKLYGWMQTLMKLILAKVQSPCYEPAQFLY